jgi:large exoprotein involved in heme utilization and adhesion
VTISGLGGENTPARVVQLTNGQVRTSTVGQGGERGDVLVRATEVLLTDRATISAESTGTDDAGNIRILDAETVRLQGQSTVTSEALQASGGNIEVRANSLIELREHSAITAEVQGVEEVGGNIDLRAEVVLVEDSNILANAPVGRGGRITIQAEGFLADADSRLDASGGLEAGVVEIQALTDLSGTEAPLPQDFVQAAALLRERCAERLRGGQFSSFVLVGRDALPAAPGGVLSSPLARGEQPEVAGIEETPELTSIAPARTLGRNDHSHPSKEGWLAQGFTPVALDLECAKWPAELRKQ